MTECFFSVPEDQEGRKQLKDFRFTDVFPQTNPYYTETDDYFPPNVTNYVHQLRSQEHLRKTAQIVNSQLEEMNLQQQHQQQYLTDDQKRAQKIKDRMMMKRKVK